MKKNDVRSRSRSEIEMKKLQDRDREVKFLENLTIIPGVLLHPPRMVIIFMKLCVKFHSFSREMKVK